MTYTLAAIGLLAASVHAAPIEIDMRDRQAVMAEAERLWAEGDMRAMASFFERAYEVEPVPEYLFGQARAEVKLGDCPRARELLEAFIATAPPASQLEAAYTEQDKCPEGDDAKQTSAPVAPALSPPTNPDEAEVTGVAATAPAPQPAPAQPNTDAVWDRPTRRPDALGWSLVGAGIAAAAVGTGLFFAGRNTVLNPAATADEDEYQDLTRRGQRMAWSGLGVGAAGVGLVVGGAIRLGLVRSRPRQARRRGGGAIARHR